VAKARNRLADLLSRWSRSLFCFLSEREADSRFIRRIKLPLLGFFVIVIGWLTTGAICTSCYLPIMTEPSIESASVTPNPTAGADSVTVEVTAEIHEERDVADTVYISRAISFIGADTVEMQAADGDLDGHLEELTSRHYVGGLEPGTTKVHVEVYNNLEERDDRTLNLEVTEGE